MCTGVLLALLSLTGAAPAGAVGGDDGERPGKLTVEIGWDASRQEVRIRERCAYALASGSEALAAVRETGEAFCPPNCWPWRPSPRTRSTR
ncbi:hypothetical protein [Streptomyces hawaiiensis]|uniref:hypothetical protein n=1 Tax=Streptomyces hawaiiensis TaxID=67305 RepID=UPI00365D49DE